MTYNLNTPILLIAFNRLDTTKQVFNSIRRQKPNHLYISSDGPRTHIPEESNKINELRDYLLKNIDWNCQVKKLFHSENKGCGPAVNEAISWVFSHEEKCIILEDDTLPDDSFYKFCDELLEKYKSDDRIGLISGNNHIGFKPENDSYIFSKFKFTWGWATWRRAWENMDCDMKFLKSSKDSIVSNMGYKEESAEIWNKKIEDLNHNRVNTWDYQWFLSLSAQNQLTIFPSKNLVANIGFGDNATHTTGMAPDSFTQKHEIKFPLKHPEYIVPNINFEKKYENIMVFTRPLWKKLLLKIVPKKSQ